MPDETPTLPDAPDGPPARRGPHWLVWGLLGCAALLAWAAWLIWGRPVYTRWTGDAVPGTFNYVAVAAAAGCFGRAIVLRRSGRR